MYANVHDQASDVALTGLLPITARYDSKTKGHLDG